MKERVTRNYVITTGNPLYNSWFSQKFSISQNMFAKFSHFVKLSHFLKLSHLWKFCISQKYFREISLPFCFIYIHKKMRNFAKKKVSELRLKIFQIFSHFFLETIRSLEILIWTIPVFKCNEQNIVNLVSVRTLHATLREISARIGPGLRVILPHLQEPRLSMNFTHPDDKLGLFNVYWK